MFNRKRLIMVLGLVCANAYSDVYSQFKKHLAPNGAEYNVTTSDYYKLQGGHYTHGGSVFSYLRCPVKAPKFLEIPKPDINHGSFELHAGGFGVISKEELVNALRSLVRERAGYAFMLALQSMNLTIWDLMQVIKRFEDKVNASSIADSNSNLKQLNNKETK